MPKEMNKILPGLFLGSYEDAEDQEQLTINRITHIVSVKEHAEPMNKNMQYLCINASDMPAQDLRQHFLKCNKFIHEARLQGGRVLVHCRQGVSRSATVILAYLITLTTHNCKDALSAVRCARNIANPNFGFTAQLQKYERESIEKERNWLKSSYPNTNCTEDHALIAEMCKQYQESEDSKRWK